MKLPSFIKTSEPLAKHTTLGIGGPAKYFAPVTDETKRILANNFVFNRKRDGYNTNIFVIGGGSNILFSDKGFNGLVIKISNNELILDEEGIEAGAGASMASLVRLAEYSGTTGFEWAAGLPGTVGGAVFGNAGCYGGQMWDSVESITCFKMDGLMGKKFEVEAGDNLYGYRWSFFKNHPDWIILSVRLKTEISAGGRNEVIRKTSEVMKKRKASQPKERSLGCIFKNPNKIPIGELELKSASWLIDKAGCKGMCIGVVRVSGVHANYFVNDRRVLSRPLSNGPANDMFELIKSVRSVVYEKFGIMLEEEIIRVGEF